MYTLEQALEIIEDFEDLVGTELVMGNPATEVMYMTLSPASLDADVSFANIFHQNILADSAYVYSNPEGVYNVAVIIGQPGAFSVKSILDYVTEAGIRYNFPA